MRNTKILVFGRIGQGAGGLRYKLAYLGRVPAIEYPKAVFSKPNAIRAAVRAAVPAVVLNTAAYTAADKAEMYSGLAVAVNATAPGVISEEAKRLCSLLVHYSTDYVLDGAKEFPDVETDALVPINVNSKAKLAGAEAIQAVSWDCLILHTRWVYGAHGSNILLTMLRLAQERQEVEIEDDQIGVPISSKCIAQAAANILAQFLASNGRGLDGCGGVYNLSTIWDAFWLGFAKVLLTKWSGVFGFTVPSLIPIRAGDFSRPAKRTANSGSLCQCLEQTFGVTCLIGKTHFLWPWIRLLKDLHLSIPRCESCRRFDLRQR